MAANTTTAIPSLLEGLKDDDSLRMALLPTSAADHVELRKTGQRIREIVDSDIFIRERCEGGFAEVNVVFSGSGSGDNNDDEDDNDDDDDDDDEMEPDLEGNYEDIGEKGEYGDWSITAKIVVDGRDAGEIDMCLLPMGSRYNFHEIGDSISDDLASIASMFFTPHGRPTRVKSIREAFDCDEMPLDDEYFLYISELKLKPLYRTTSHVCAHALKNLLDESRLAPLCTIAMYIPFGRNHMTKEELNKKYGEDEDTMDPHACFHKKPSQEYLDILDAKTLVDMRYFLRAGFQQVPEMIGLSDYYYLFHVATFDDEMMSEEQALSMKIKVAPKPPPPLSQEAQELLNYFIRQCSMRRSSNTQTIQKMDAQVRKMLKDSVSKHGKSIIQDSNLLHACASNGDQALVEIILDFVSDKQDKLQLVNSLDRNSATPLMIAASSRCENNTMIRLCYFLINQGADKDLVDVGGMTALGKLRVNMRSGADFARAMYPQELAQVEIEGIEKLSELLEPLLMPSNGPTEADEGQLM